MPCLRYLSLLILSLSLHYGFAQNPLGSGYKPIQIDSSYEHNKWGISPTDMPYYFAAYTLSFDSEDDNNADGSGDKWAIPEWVAYEVKRKTNQEEPSYSRPSWMTVDSLFELGLIPTNDSYHVKGTRDLKEVKTDYRFIRGHLCPKETADRISMEAGWNTHTFLNAVPQLQWQNNGPWKALELDILNWADTYGRVWVITGPVFFARNPALWLGQETEVKVAVPDALFKIVIRESDGPSGIESLCFIIPNVLPKNIEYFHFLCSMKYVSRCTGLQFLTNLPEDQRSIEYQKQIGEDLVEKLSRVEAW